MTNEEAYQRLRTHGTSPEGACLVLTYAYWAQLSGGWAKLFIPGTSQPYEGGSEGEKGRAMDILREAGIDPMAVSFPDQLSGSPSFGTNSRNSK